MIPDDEIDALIAETFKLASEDAVVSTIEQLAIELGVSSIQGLPIRRYFDQAKRAAAEIRLAAYADEDPNLASRMKQYWQQLDRDAGEGSEES